MKRADHSSWMPTVRRCEVCFGLACYGYGATRGQVGRWFCTKHRPPGDKLPPAASASGTDGDADGGTKNE